MLLASADVHLPSVFSKKGFNRANYTPRTNDDYVWLASDFPSVADVRQEYAESVERAIVRESAPGGSVVRYGEVGRSNSGLQEAGRLRVPCDLRSGSKAAGVIN